jgi:hypothetical protein
LVILAKFGRKVCCLYTKDVQCIRLINGKRFCFVDESTEEQWYEKHEAQFGVCPLLPEVNKVAFMDALNKKGGSIVRRWRE